MLIGPGVKNTIENYLFLYIYRKREIDKCVNNFIIVL